MKNLVLGVALTAFLFTAAPVHAQVVVPTDRASIIALIQILLERIEEIKAEMAEKEKAQAKIVKEEKRKAYAEKKARKEYENEVAEMKERYLKVQEFIINFETVGHHYLIEYAGHEDARGITIQQVNKLNNESRYELAKTILANLKVEKLQLENSLKELNAN